MTVSPSSINEAGGVSTVAVSTGGATFPTERAIALVLSGTAEKDTDYTVGPETLTLPAGATEVETTVTAVQDTLDDDAETIVITAEGAEATVTITDDVDAVQRVNAGGFSPAPLQTLRRDARLDSAAVRQALGEARIVTAEEHGRIAAQAVNLPVVPRARAAALALNTVHPRRDEPVAELATEQDDRDATHRVNESGELASCALAAR